MDWSTLLATVPGGALALAGGWIQTERTLSAEKKQWFHDLYRPLVAAEYEATIAARVLGLPAPSSESKEIQRPTEWEKGQIDKANKALEQGRASINWLALESDVYGRHVRHSFIMLEGDFQYFTMLFESFCRETTPIEKLKEQESRVLSSGEMLTKAMRRHLAILERSTLDRTQVWGKKQRTRIRATLSKRLP